MTWHSVDLPQAIPADLQGDFLAKLHYVSAELTRFDLEPDGSRVRFQVKDAPGAEATVIGERIRHVARKLCEGFRPLAAKVLVDRSARTPSFHEDPHPLLERSGDLWHYGQGRYGFGPLLVRLIDVFERRFLTFAAECEAAPHQFPTLVGADLLDRCRYLQSFPQSLNLVAHLRPDLEAINHFAANARWEADRLKVDFNDLESIRCLLSPAVCFHCYGWLSKTTQPNRAITAVGKCFRYESGNLGGLERLWDFTMREIIFVGTPSHVLAKRQQLIERTRDWLDDVGMAYQVKTATDPFFLEGFSAQSTFQKAFDLKFEVRAALPYRPDGKDLAIGSFNYHQDFFGRSLEIKNPAGEPVHTGCVAYGLERVALAFLAQFGLEPKRWPDAVAREYRNARP